MSSSQVDPGSRRVGAGGATRPSVSAALRWALVGVAAGTVVSGFRVFSSVAAPVASNGSAAAARRVPTGGPAAPPAVGAPPDPATNGAAVPPPLPAHERVLVTVASPAGTPYRRPAPVLMRLPARPAAARGTVPG